MQNKLIVAAVGTFGLGALVGWAISADIHENQLIDERASYDKMIKEKTEHIWALQDRIERNWVATVSSNDSSLTQPIGEVVNSSQMELIVDINDVVGGWGVTQPVNQFETKEEPVVVEESVPEETEEESVPEGETPEETRTNLQNLIDTYTADQDAQEEFVNIATRSVDIDKTPPYVISRAMYAWDEEGDSFAKITLTYFPRDRVLLDDDEDPIADVASTVGWRSLSQFGSESEDPDVVFVRNRRMETDFEVIKEDESDLPLHVRYGMEKEEFHVNRAAGRIKLRQEDDDH